jgi:putative transposase
MPPVSRVLALSRVVFSVFIDVTTFLCLRLRSSSALVAENLFLRKQLAMYVERKQKPRRATHGDRFTLAQLIRFF